MSKIEDRSALHDLMARYIDAVNRVDGAAWAATWASDGRWQLLGNEIHGRSQILAHWQQVMAGFEFAIMMPGSGLVDVDGDIATGHWYLQEHIRDRQGNRARILSRYRDTCRREDGQWLYQSRAHEILYYGAPDLGGTYTPLPG